MSVHTTFEKSDTKFTFQRFFQIFRSIESFDFGWCIDVRQIGRNSGCVHDIVQAQLGNKWALFQQQAQWLADTTAGAAHSNFNIVLKIFFFEKKRRKLSIRIKKSLSSEKIT